MGKEWYRVAGGRTSEPKKDARTAWWGGGNSRSKSLTKETTRATVAGCMNVVFHLFDFHRFRFPDTSEIENDDSLPKGVEAPRNSLESTEEAPLSPIRRDDHLNLSIKTKPTRSSELESLTSNESSYSPTAKTPTLVARLMGLDLLPDKSLISPSSSPTTCSSAFSVDLGTPNLRTRTHGKRHRHYSLRRNSVDGGTSSLPEMPRISLGRRSDADCYQQRRMSSSLHINRHDTNVSESEEEHGHVMFSSLTLKEIKTNDDKENPSPRKYASQIAVQLKESVSRRMGSDITNTMRNNEQSRDHHHHHHYDSKKASRNTSSDSSPRLRFLENQKAKPPPPSQTNVAQIVEDKPRLWRVKEEPQPKLAQEEEQKQERETRRKAVKKCKKPADNEMKFGSRLQVKPPQTVQEEPFVRSPVGKQSSSSSTHHHHHQRDKKCKKTPLSNELLNLTSVPCLLPVKKKDPSNLYGDVLKFTEIQLPRNRSEFLRCWSQTQTYVVRKDILTNTTSAAAAASSEELDYITRIFRRIGIDKNTLISHAKWFSPSHPLDPSIFYSLEHFTITSARTKGSPGNLGLRCNRKLLFHLADEILIDVLKPHMNMKPWVDHYPILYRRELRGSELIDELCRKIGEFTLSDCRGLGDIDALVAGDLPGTKRRRELAVEEEREAVITELEREILETLVNETTMDCVRVTKTLSFVRMVSVSRDEMLLKLWDSPHPRGGK